MFPLLFVGHEVAGIEVKLLVEVPHLSQHWVRVVTLISNLLHSQNFASSQIRSHIP